MKSDVLTSLCKVEMDYLMRYFRLSQQITLTEELSISSIDLLDEEKCLDFMWKLKEKLQAPSCIVAASQFSKRYSFLTMVPSLYAMTMFNKGLDLTIENCHIQSCYQKETWLPHLYLNDMSVAETTDLNRKHWRDQVINSIFANNISKVWHSIVRAVNIPISVLWENTAIYVYWLYEKRINEEASEIQHARIHKDFQYLLHEAKGSLFGQTENPLQLFHHKHQSLLTSEQPVRIRKTCCLNYQVATGQKKFCSTCPKNRC